MQPIPGKAAIPCRERRGWEQLAFLFLIKKRELVKSQPVVVVAFATTTTGRQGRAYFVDKAIPIPERVASLGMERQACFLFLLSKSYPCLARRGIKLSPAVALLPVPCLA
jgi:hypothetical protein